MIAVALFTVTTPRSGQAEFMRNLARYYPEQLLNSKVERVGSLDLTQLLKNFKSVKAIAFKKGFPSGSTGRRSGVINLPSHKEIYYSPLAFSQARSIEVQRVWALHEFLEASGYYQDEDYALSLSLWWMATRDPAQREFMVAVTQNLFQDLLPVPVNRTYMIAGGGGVTGVGGGGDHYSLHLKMDLMSAAIDFRNLSAPARKQKLIALYQKILVLSVETEYDLHSRSRDIQAKPYFYRSRAHDGEWAVLFPVIAGLVEQYRAQATQSILEVLYSGELP